jgi:beta-phosphoglucomutase-like phosphatase (HAD superfamily)
LKLKALILDVDGTLADTEETHRCAFNEAFRLHSLAWNWSRPAYAQLLSIGGGKQRLQAYIDSLTLSASERARLSKQIPALHRSKTDIYTAALSTGAVQLRNGVERLLEECVVAGVKLAIATTTTAANIDSLLRGNLGADALEKFAVIGAGDVVDRMKPAPDIYEWTLRRLEESPANCVAIEDSANGLAAAKAAGLFTVVTPTHWTMGEDFSAADLLLPSLGSAEHPLSGTAAAQIGSTTLGVKELERQLLGQTSRPRNFQERQAGAGNESA